MQLSVVIVALGACLHQVMAFSPAVSRNIVTPSAHRSGAQTIAQRTSASSTTILHMSDSGGGGGGAMERDTSKKRGLTTITIDKEETDTQMEEDDTPEEVWRVILHNDEVHTFNYVIRSLQKVIGTLDKKKAHDICVVTHGTGQATVTQCWKEQAMKYCVGMQRFGLTASIAPEGKFEGGGNDGPEAG
jgi:ATP-dependent Clp protease adapter protein ClpS